MNTSQDSSAPIGSLRWIPLLSLILFVSCPVSHMGANEGGVEPLAVTDSDTPETADGETEDDVAAEDGGTDASPGSLHEMERLGRLVSLDPGPMAPFFDALADIENGGLGTARVLHYGDSHTAADFITTAIRRPLQKRFGDGGRGFVLLGKPWRSYLPKDVETGARGPWTTERILIAADPARLDGRYGLGGVSVNTRDRTAATWVSTVGGNGLGSKMSSFEVFYLEQPRGGSFTLWVDGVRKSTVRTASRRHGTGFFRLELNEGAHRVELRAGGDGRLRLFGAVVENDGPGLVYDALGINGAFFYTPLRWDASLLEEQVERRDPDLIVTMYGANEADSRNLTPERYARDVKRVLARLRAGAPEAACLLLGPPDRVMPPTADDRPTKLDWIVEVQEAVAGEEGCAFLDTRGLMGGAGSHGVWESRGLAQPDGIHLTVKGYNLLGEMLADEIIDAYESYLGESWNPRAVQ